MHIRFNRISFSGIINIPEKDLFPTKALLQKKSGIQSRWSGLTCQQSVHHYRYLSHTSLLTPNFSLFASPFGVVLQEREFSSSAYKHGFNGQERDDEVAGPGNSYTAEFWQYDSRLGRRWNIDPVVDHGISNYHSFKNSPITKFDGNGANATDYRDSKGNLLAKTNDGLNKTVVIIEGSEQNFIQEFNGLKSRGEHNHLMNNDYLSRKYGKQSYNETSSEQTALKFVSPGLKVVETHLKAKSPAVKGNDYSMKGTSKPSNAYVKNGNGEVGRMYKTNGDLTTNPKYAEVAEQADLINRQITGVKIVGGVLNVVEIAPAIADFIEDPSVETATTVAEEGALMVADDYAIGLICSGNPYSAAVGVAYFIIRGIFSLEGRGPTTPEERAIIEEMRRRGVSLVDNTYVAK